MKTNRRVLWEFSRHKAAESVELMSDGHSLRYGDATIARWQGDKLVVAPSRFAEEIVGFKGHGTKLAISEDIPQRRLEVSARTDGKHRAEAVVTSYGNVLAQLTVILPEGREKPIVQIKTPEVEDLCDKACIEAKHQKCDCSCGGRNHSVLG